MFRAVETGLRGFERTGAYPFAVVDVPLLYETGAEQHYDKVIVTVCPAAMQIERLTARGLTDAAARQRIAAQWPTADKAARADFVVETDGSFADTDRQVDDIHRALSLPS